MGDLFGKGPKNHTTTTKTEVPDYVESLIKGAAGGMQGYVNNPNVHIAPLTGNQKQAGQTYADLNQFARGTDYSGQALGANVPNMSSQAMELLGLGGRAAEQAGQYATTNFDQISALANPYAEAVTDASMRRLDEGRRNAQADIGARAAAGGAFGGSGEAIERSMLNRNYMDSARDTATQTAYDAYNTGAGLAQGNVAAQNNAMQSRANALLQSLGLDQQSLGLASNMGNQAFENSLQRANTASGLATDYMNRGNIAAGGLMDYGSMQRQYNQAVGDRPYTQFSRLQGLLSGAPTSTTSTQPIYNSGGSSLGNALMLGSMFAG